MARLFDWLGKDDQAWKLGSTMSDNQSIIPYAPTPETNISNYVEESAAMRQQADEALKQRQSPGNAVGQAIRSGYQEFPALPEPYMPPELMDLYNAPPPGVGDKPKMGLGQAMKGMGLSMIPFVGPALAGHAMRGHSEAMQDWQVQKQAEVETWQQGRQMAADMLKDQYKQYVRNTNVTRYAQYFMTAHNQSPDDAMRNAVAYADSKAMPGASEQDTMTPMTLQLKDGTQLVGLRDKSGNFFRGNPAGGVEPVPLSDIGAAYSIGQEPQRSALQEPQFRQVAIARYRVNNRLSAMDPLTPDQEMQALAQYGQNDNISVAEQRYIAMVEARTGKPFMATTPPERYRAELEDKKANAEMQAEAGIIQIATQDADGNAVTILARKTPGEVYEQPISAAREAEEDARRTLAGLMPQLRMWADKLITEIGPSQRALAAKQGTEAVLGHNATYRAYMDIRAGVVLALAAMLNRGRPTDKDYEAAANYLPNPFTDTAESAPMKWDTLSMFLEPNKMVYVTTDNGKGVAAIPIIEMPRYLYTYPNEKRVFPKSQE